MALSAAASAKLAALIAKLGKYNAAFDIEENMKRLAGQQALGKLDENLPVAKTAVARSLADRGLVQSGIGLGGLDTVNRNYLQQYGDQQRDTDVALSELARRRLTGQADFDYESAGISREDMFGQPIIPPPPTAPVAAPPRAPSSSTSSYKPVPRKPKTPPKAPSKPQTPAATNPTVPAKPKSTAPTFRAGVPQPVTPKKPVTTGPKIVRK